MAHVKKNLKIISAPCQERVHPHCMVDFLFPLEGVTESESLKSQAAWGSKLRNLRWTVGLRVEPREK